MVTVSACVTDANTLEEQVEVHTILRQSPLLVVVHILYVLVLHTDVVLETVTDVVDVLPTPTVIT
jgi:hypothetical protein|tara:strand:- start:2908 stop:3102 length:195 start_codon:yes stop_codon:yes gene_type:complete